MKVKIFPSGSSWDLWDAHRGQALAVDFDSLAAAFPADQWVSMDAVSTWPGSGWTVVESDAPEAFGNAFLLVPFEQVKAQVAVTAAGAAATGGWVGIALLVGIGALVYWSGQRA